jgi:hypothetical protein
MKYILKRPGKPIEVKEVKELTLELIQAEIDGMVEVLNNPFGNDPELQIYMNEEPSAVDKPNFNFCNATTGFMIIYGNVVFLRFREGADAPEGLTDNQIIQLKEMEELKK